MPLQVTTFGSGPDIALLHGWGFGRGVWKEIASRLAEDFRLHLISLPGYDESFPDSRDFDATASALIKTLPAGSTLCGWSMGGMLALAATAYHPNHFERLVLVGTTPKFVQASDWTPGQPDESLETFLHWVLQAPEITLANFITLLSRNNTKTYCIPHHLEALLENKLPAASVLEKGLTWLRDVDLRQLASQVTLPTLIVHGDQDLLIPASAAIWLSATLPCSQLRLCADAAHAPFASNPDHFCSMLTEFCSDPR